MQKDKPSRTALKVALGILTLGEKPDMMEILPKGILEATHELLANTGLISERNLERTRSTTMVKVYEFFDWMMPGEFQALGHRKAFFEEWAQKSIASGATQVLVLGAGYDTLGWRLAPKHADVHFFEIDHPATAQIKADAIEKMGKHANLTLISEDLGQRSLLETLKECSSWNPTAKSLIIAEGLLMYLDPTAVHELFSQCHKITGAESIIAFSFIPSNDDGKMDAGPCTGMMRFLQDISGEPWLWSIHPEDLPDYLNQLNWSINAEKVGIPIKQGIEYFAATQKIN